MGRKKNNQDCKNVLPGQESFLFDSLSYLAKGYTTSECVEEFVCDKEGNKTLKSQKITTRKHAPDINSIKILCEMNNSSSSDCCDYSNFSDEELLTEKNRLIKILSEQSN